MIFFVIAVAIYIYSWISFKPVEKKEVVIKLKEIHVAKTSNHSQDFFSFHLFS
tara:strand:+ start:641 stop:799 length:159 start_codon:yes stop_codon:yes gene_type:complete